MKTTAFGRSRRNVSIDRHVAQRLQFTDRRENWHRNSSQPMCQNCHIRQVCGGHRPASRQKNRLRVAGSTLVSATLDQSRACNTVLLLCPQHHTLVSTTVVYCCGYNILLQRLYHHEGVYEGGGEPQASTSVNRCYCSQWTNRNPIHDCGGKSTTDLQLL